MTTTFSQPVLSEGQPSSVNLQSLLLEPFLLVACSFFWLAVLPLTGVVCGSVALYDKLSSLSGRTLRFPTLRQNMASNPLVLRKKKSSTEEPAQNTRGGQRVFQS